VLDDSARMAATAVGAVNVHSVGAKLQCIEALGQ
jgi:hypothetical protein